MVQKYKLTYFNLRALAEPIRLVFAHAKVEYEDVRVDFNNDWPSIKPTMPWGKLPVLDDGDIVLSQSLAIIKYVSKKLNYSGDNAVEEAKCDEYVGAMQDFNELCMSFGQENDPERKKEKEIKMRAAFPFYLGKFNQILKDNGGIFLVGKKFTYADFYVAHFIQTSLSLESNFLDEYPELRQHQDTVFNSPGIKEWVAKRPVTRW